MPRILTLAAFVLIACQPEASAQEKSAEQQIAEAVMAAPEPFRADATVKGYQDGKLVDLRQGTGIMVCLADRPGDDRWSVACYQKGLEPFMARGRQLRAEGKERDERQRMRLAEIESGDLEMPRHPMALYVMTGSAVSYDAATGEVTGASRRQVLYVPYATVESLGISAEPSREKIWLMAPGTPTAHLMIPSS